MTWRLTLRTDAFVSLLLALRYPLLSPCLLQPIIPDSYLTPDPPPTQAALDWASDGTDPFHPYQGGPAGRLFFLFPVGNRPLNRSAAPSSKRIRTGRLYASDLLYQRSGTRSVVLSEDSQLFSSRTSETPLAADPGTVR